MKGQEFYSDVSKATSKILEVKPQRRDEKADKIINECLAKWSLDGAMSAFKLAKHLGMQFLIDTHVIR